MIKIETEKHIKPRFKMLDCFRGLAILLIVCAHLLPDYIDNKSILKVLTYGRVGTSVFFVISGFSVAIACHKIINSSLRPIDFIRTRYARIYNVYFLSLITALLIIPSIMPLVSYLKSGELVFHYLDFSLIHLLRLVTLTQVFEAESWQLHTAFAHNGSYWFIAVIVQIYLFLAVVLCFKRAFYPAVSITFILSCFCLIPGFRDFFPYGLFLPKFAEFFMGMILFLLLNNFPAFRASTAWWLWLLTIALAGITFWGSYQDNVFRLLTALLMAHIFLCLYPYDESLSNLALVKGFRRVGAYSYSVFLMHVPLAPFIQMFIRNFSPMPDYWSAPLLLIPSVFICSYLWFLYFEQPGSLKGTLRALVNPVATLSNRFRKR